MNQNIILLIFFLKNFSNSEIQTRVLLNANACLLASCNPRCLRLHFKAEQQKHRFSYFDLMTKIHVPIESFHWSTNFTRETNERKFTKWNCSQTIFVGPEFQHQKANHWQSPISDKQFRFHWAIRGRRRYRQLRKLKNQELEISFDQQ